MNFASCSRRRGALAVAVAAGAAVLLGPAGALAAHNVIEPISIAPDGTIGNDSSASGDHLGDYGDMTPDGRFVVFASFASNLVPGDTNGFGDVFVRDRATATTESISADGGGDDPGISPDGNFVAFETRGFDGDFVDDIYLRDRATGTIERISVSLDGGAALSPSEDPVVATAPNGRPIVAFASGAANLVPDDGTNIDVFVRDLSGPTPRTELVSVSSDEQPAGEFNTSRNPAITGDGRFVAFQSDAQNFTAVPQAAFFADIFVRDRQATTTVLASPNGTNGEASGQSEDPEISADGRFVAFASFASDLIEDGPDPDGELVRDAFVRDLATASTETISVNSAHEDATRNGFHDDVGAGPVSADGLVTLMATQADNFFAGDDNSGNDVYVSDRRPAADLSLEKLDEPDPVAPRATLTYALGATNNGPNAAPGTHILDTLPASVTFVSASAGCTHSAGQVDCDLGELASGDSAEVAITVTPKARGVITNTARLGSYPTVAQIA